jgi:diaminopimelate decarboxylase
MAFTGFSYVNGVLHCEGADVNALATKYETPLYIYSANAMRARVRELQQAFSSVPTTLCFSVKANSNLGVLGLMRDLGTGFDIVSRGELFRLKKLGVDFAKHKVVFAGVGKTDREIDDALAAGIYAFTVESTPELDAIAARARALGKKNVKVDLRMNPDVDPQTHKYITTGKEENKFGVDFNVAREVFKSRAKWPELDLSGGHCHIGSQITSVDPYRKAMARVTDLILDLRSEGVPFNTLDFGGGFGIDYTWVAQPAAVPVTVGTTGSGGSGGVEGEVDAEAKVGNVPSPAEFAAAITPFVKELGVSLLLEPGRYIAGNSGIMVTSVVFKKTAPSRTFVITDAGMNDLVRPSLYQAKHMIWPALAEQQPGAAGLPEFDVVGPICESGCSWRTGYALPEKTDRGTRLVFFGAGAYGHVMASNYNTRPQPAEIVVDGGNAKLTRRRQTLDDLLAAELELL